MYLVTAEEMKKLDRSAINEIGIPGLVLMENAGLQVVKIIEKVLGTVRRKNITVFAGKGNNGGDGFVIARHLANMGAEVKVLLLANHEDVKGDAEVNLKILKNTGQKVHSIINANNLNLVRLAMFYTDLVVDAVYGTGFKGAVDEYTGKIFEIINSSGKPVIAVDIPSGLEADTGRIHGPVIKAAHTVTFALPKIGLVIYPGACFVGKLHIADISIPDSLILQHNIKQYLITGEMVSKLIPRREPESHKGDFGRLLLLGGSEGLTGAVAMAANAALRIGAGLITAGIPLSLNYIMEMKLTEVMTKPLAETKDKTLSLGAWPVIEKLLHSADILAMGPGISTNEETVNLVQKIVKGLKIPAVIDADGLNAIARDTSVLVKCKAPVVLTPHPGEMARLKGIKIEEVQNNRIEIAREAAKEWQKILVLKGARTVIATPGGEVYINPTGNPGMATGGTGDVLTGIIAGLMAQGVKPEMAAVAGVYIHGMSADIASEDVGEMSLAAADIIDYLPRALKKLRCEEDKYEGKRYNDN